jgi:outer membrane immunogenic protein
MKKSVSLVIVTALAAVTGGRALAADMAVKAPPLPPPPPVYSWTGCYIGGNGGGLWTHKVWTSDIGRQVADYHVDGWLGGAQAGCDYETPSRLVFGVQGDYDGISASASSANLLTTHIYETKIISLASVTGRAGYAFDRLLTYVKGGGAWERDSYNTAILATGTVETQFSGTRSGWTLGAGAEYAFTNYLSGFVEYDYYNFGSQTDAFQSTNVATVQNYTIKETKNVFKVGLNLRWGGAPLTLQR